MSKHLYTLNKFIIQLHLKELAVKRKLPVAHGEPSNPKCIIFSISTRTLTIQDNEIHDNRMNVRAAWNQLFWEEKNLTWYVTLQEHSSRGTRMSKHVYVGRRGYGHMTIPVKIWRLSLSYRCRYCHRANLIWSRIPWKCAINTFLLRIIGRLSVGLRKLWQESGRSHGVRA